MRGRMRIELRGSAGSGESQAATHQEVVSPELGCVGFTRVLTAPVPSETMTHALSDSWRHRRYRNHSDRVRYSGDRAPAQALRPWAVAKAQGHGRNSAPQR